MDDRLREVLRHVMTRTAPGMATRQIRSNLDTLLAYLKPFWDLTTFTL
jgi:hypothetical protein